VEVADDRMFLNATISSHLYFCNTLCIPNTIGIYSYCRGGL
jgi:hypothetical protein